MLDRTRGGDSGRCPVGRSSSGPLLGLLLHPGSLAGDRAGTDRPVKRLIEFGWDEPDTAFLRGHLAELERTPFDGCVFHVMARGRRGAARTSPGSAGAGGLHGR